ncbi:MAG: hypothetical protein KAS32_07445 [Candidatus Peribacteraceae bacterium]|nr:hypothetical protein [Candidatus Peribacteraceae bacterium]
MIFKAATDRFAQIQSLLSLLIFLSLLETVISFFLNFIFGTTTLVFPLVDWISLMGFVLVNWFLSGLHLINSFFGALLSILPGVNLVTLGDLFLALYQSLLFSFVLPLTLLYPILSLMDFFFDALLGVPFFSMLIMDTFILGGGIEMIDPPPGNVMHLLYNATRMDVVIAKLLSAMAAYGMYTSTNLRGFIFYAAMSNTDRINIWKDHYEKERDPMDGYE